MISEQLTIQNKHCLLQKQLQNKIKISSNKNPKKIFNLQNESYKKDSVDTNCELSKRNSAEQNIDTNNISFNRNYFQNQFKTQESNQYQNNKDISSLSQTIILESQSSLKKINCKLNQKIINALQKIDNLKNLLLKKCQFIQQKGNQIKEKIKNLSKNFIQLQRICDVVKFNFQINQDFENFEDFYKIFKNKFKQLKSEISESKKTLYQNQIHLNKQHIYQLEDDNKSLNYFKNQIVNFFSFDNGIISSDDPDEIMFEKIHHFLYQNSKMLQDKKENENIISNYKELLRKEKEELQDKNQIINDLDQALITQKKKFNQQKKILQDQINDIKNKANQQQNQQSFKDSQKLFDQYQKTLKERDKQIASLKMEIARQKLIDSNQPEKDFNSLSYVPSRESQYSEEDSYKLLEYKQKRSKQKIDVERIPTKQKALTQEQKTQKKIQRKFKMPLDLEGITEENEEDDSLDENFFSEYDTCNDDFPDFLFEKKKFVGDVLISSEKDIEDLYSTHDYKPNFDKQF